jgi:hypothetical protein
MRPRGNAWSRAPLRLWLVCAGLMLLPPCLTGAAAQPARGRLKSLGTLLGADAPYVFPEKLTVSRAHKFYLLDTELRTIFAGERARGEVTRLCEPGALGRISDMTVDPQENLWVLDPTKAKIARLDARCQVRATFTADRSPLRLQANAFGEVVVLTGEGDALFDLYSAAGKRLRRFGQRLRYGNPTADHELSNGHLVADNAGGFYFSFNYPPLVQHYDRGGRLLSEFRPASERPIGPPDISVRQQGNMYAVTSRYPILVLDMALDKFNRLYLLTSGEDKSRALNQGSRKIVVTSGRGKVLRALDLEATSFHRLAAGADGSLYLLRNRRPYQLERYALP